MFAIGRFTVTFSEWDAAQAHPEWREQAKIEPRKANDHGWGRGKQPAIDVSWNDAKAYCAWLSGVTGKSYYLPHEWDWERACRAGSRTKYWWGDQISAERANFAPSKRLMPVDSFEPNPWGLYQVHGNVREWCEDVYLGAWPAPPGSPSRPPVRVVRGGAYNDSPVNLCSDDRGYDDPDTRRHDLGFRMARR